MLFYLQYLYRKQRYPIKAYFTYCSFFRMAQRGPGVKCAGKFVKGWRIEKNNSNLKGRRERID